MDVKSEVNSKCIYTKFSDDDESHYSPVLYINCKKYYKCFNICVYTSQIQEYLHMFFFCRLKYFG